MEDLYTKETHHIGINDVDYMGRYQLCHLFNQFSLLATTNAEKLGMWNVDMKKKYGWVVAKQTLVLDEPIMLGDNVELSTLVNNGSFVSFPRYYFIYKEGKQIGHCSSVWTLIDIEKRRMVVPKRIGLHIPQVEHDIKLEDPYTIDSPFSLHFHSERQVLYSDLDINQHMNNTRYIQWALDIIDYRLHKDAYIQEITIHYKKEIRPNEFIELYIGHDELCYVVEGRLKDGTVCFEIEMKFKKL